MIKTYDSLKLVIISGPSGVGKNTLLDSILKKYPDKFEEVVSYTTRNIRPDEINGIDYNFISEKEFKHMIASNDLFEYVHIFNNYYGSSKSLTYNIFNSGKIPVLVLDVAGALSIKKQISGATLIFISATIKDIESRLIARGDTSLEQIKTRLSRINLELSQKIYYDLTIVNHKLSDAILILENYLLALYY